MSGRFSAKAAAVAVGKDGGLIWDQSTPFATFPCAARVVIEVSIGILTRKGSSVGAADGAVDTRTGRMLR